MSERPFTLAARIRMTDHAALGAVLSALITQGVVTPTAEGFRVEAALEGTNARDLNRMLLSALGRIDRRATMHAAWTSEGTTEHFFDYTVLETRSTQTQDTKGDVNRQGIWREAQRVLVPLPIKQQVLVTE